MTRVEPLRRSFGKAPGMEGRKVDLGQGASPPLRGEKPMDHKLHINSPCWVCCNFKFFLKKKTLYVNFLVWPTFTELI